MKVIMKVFVFLFFFIGVTSCFSSRPLRVTQSENNATYNVSYLFEHDGCKVYRFYDNGNYVYFTTLGDVTSIKADSTKERTTTIRYDKFQHKK